MGDIFFHRRVKTLLFNKVITQGSLKWEHLLKLNSCMVTGDAWLNWSAWWAWSGHNNCIFFLRKQLHAFSMMSLINWMEGQVMTQTDGPWIKNRIGFWIISFESKKKNLIKIIYELYAQQRDGLKNGRALEGKDTICGQSVPVLAVMPIVRCFHC